jgi:hypothetical protein
MKVAVWARTSGLSRSISGAASRSAANRPGGEIGESDGEAEDARHVVCVLHRLTARHAQAARRDILDDEGQLPGGRDAGAAPLQLHAVRPRPRAVHRRVGEARAGEAGNILREVGAAEGEVDQPAARVEKAPPAMLGWRSGILEGDQFDVRAVREGDQGIVRAAGVFATRYHGEAQTLIIADAGRQIGDENNEVIDPGEHGCRPPLSRYRRVMLRCSVAQIAGRRQSWTWAV